MGYTDTAAIAGFAHNCSTMHQGNGILGTDRRTAAISAAVNLRAIRCNFICRSQDLTVSHIVVHSIRCRFSFGNVHHCHTGTFSRSFCLGKLFAFITFITGEHCRKIPASFGFHEEQKTNKNKQQADTENNRKNHQNAPKLSHETLMPKSTRSMTEMLKNTREPPRKIRFESLYCIRHLKVYRSGAPR